MHSIFEDEKIADELRDIKSAIFVRENALEHSERTLRDLQLMENDPAAYSDSIFSSINLVKEMNLIWDHIQNLRKQLEKEEAKLFKHKLKYGDE